MRIEQLLKSFFEDADAGPDNSRKPWTIERVNLAVKSNKIKRIGFYIRYLDKNGSVLTGRPDVELMPLIKDHSRLNRTVLSSQDIVDRTHTPEKYTIYQIIQHCDDQLVDPKVMAQSIVDALKTYSISKLIIETDIRRELVDQILSMIPAGFTANTKNPRMREAENLVAVIFRNYVGGM